MEPKPTFVNRRQAAGVPIRNPDTGVVVDVSTLQHTPITPVVQSVNGQQTMGRHATQNPPQQPALPGASDRKATPSSGIMDGLEPGFDVYATPFVPKVLKAVNSLQCHAKLVTAPLKNIDLTGYAGWWLGSGRLPTVPPPVTTSPVALSLAPATYELFFRYHLCSEVASQYKENAMYSLYAHEVRATLPQGIEAAICTVVVPGLREYSPYVEEDDEVILRQLRTDQHGHPIHIQPQLQQTYYPQGYHSYLWNGVEYRGRVSAVLIAAETLVVKVHGLTYQMAEPQVWNALGSENIFNFRFNIQFPVQANRFLPMEHVLPHIQTALNQASSRTHDRADGFSGASDLLDEVQYWVQAMLFPTEADCGPQFNLNSGHFGHEYVDNSLNLEQKTAVENICLQNYGTVPYIISGPPGTGKTKTIIEIALQLLDNVDEVSHILVCAPSEPATDTLADRLRHRLQPHEMLRLNRPTRSFNEVDPHLLPYCCISDDMFILPKFDQLMKYRVVVTSCRDACMLMYSRMTNGDLYAAEHGLSVLIHPFHPSKPSEVRLHWTALLLDEAAQAMEPEALLPLHVVSPPLVSSQLAFTPLFVMAGDECQLGPRTSSPQTTLKRSLFARLFSRPVYANHPLARGKAGEAPPLLTPGMLPILRPPFTNLVRNYRSHPAILAMPSKLFYFDTLQAETLQPVLTLARWDGWKGKRWPILYHNNQSPDDLEGDGGGWFNDGEATLALQYARRLSTFLGGQQRDICIMSPFKAQVRLLRKKARSPHFSLHDVNIGPTEAFQGLEHGVVILCVTRSRKRFVEKDKDVSWGIIGQPNKMNVALTRAKYGLIILGSQDVLVDDAHWKAVLRFYYRSGSVINPQDVNAMLDTEEGELTKFEEFSMTKQWSYEDIGDDTAHPPVGRKVGTT